MNLVTLGIHWLQFHPCQIETRTEKQRGRSFVSQKKENQKKQRRKSKVSGTFDVRSRLSKIFDTFDFPTPI